MQLAAHDLYLLQQCAISAACQAGHVIAGYATRSVAINSKDGGSSLAAQVVTEVDHISQDIILRALQPTCQQFDLALLSEESTDDRQRLQKDYFWCIDPLDGTLPFIESLPGYSVSIALVSRAGIPLIGVIYDPLRQTLYQARQGQGAWRNHQALRPPSRLSTTQTLSFLTDKSFADDPLYAATILELQAIASDLGYAEACLQLQGGAAINACEVLNNPATCYFKFPKRQPGGGSIWDYAATACLFAELGLSASDIAGNALAFNPTGSTFFNHCGVLYCADPALASAIQSAYKKLTADKVTMDRP